MKNSTQKILEHQNNSRKPRIPKYTEQKMSNHPMTLRKRGKKEVNTIHTSHFKKNHGKRRTKRI